LENYRTYANGESHLDPGSVDAIRVEMKRLPEKTWSWVAMFLFGGLAWSWTRSEAATMLFALLGGGIVLIYFRIERLYFQHQIRDEYTRAIVREVAAETSFDLERLRSDLEPLLSPHRRDYSDPTRDA